MKLTETYIKDFARHLGYEEKSAATQEKYLRDAQAFCAFADGREISKELVMLWKQKLIAEGYAVRSVNSMLASVNSLLEFMGLQGCKVKSIRTQRKTYCAEDKELTKAEYLRLLSASKKNEQLNLVLQTICGTGIRVSELQYFTVEAVRRGEVTVDCKNKTRTILIPGKLKNILLNYLVLEISGGDESYRLQELENGSSYIARVYYQGVLLTGSELEKVELKWLPETSNAEIKKEFADDHWNLNLSYKDPENPQDTVCGECTVEIQAFYAAEGYGEAQAEAPLTYNIYDDFTPLQMELYVPETYIVIKDIEDSQEIVVNLMFNGIPLTAEEFANASLQVDCGGVEHTITANEQNSSYSIQLMPTNGLAEGKYPVKVIAVFTDPIGRETQAEDAVTITLSNIPLWVRWVIGMVLLLVLFLIVWAILHIKVLPTKAHTTRKLSNLNFDGEDVTKSASFLTEVKKDGARMQAQYGGRKFGLIMDVAPGQESYLYKSHKGRSAVVKPASVRKFGPAKIQEALIGTAKYTVDDETGKLVPALPNQKPFLLKNGATVRYSGTISDAGIDKDFEVLSKISFNKK